MAEEMIKIDDVEYKLDESGNALDDKGTIFKTKDEIESFSSKPDGGEGDDVSQIKIDDVVYKLDDKGNAIDDNGAIFMSAEDITKHSSTSNDTLVDFDLIRKYVGYEPKDNKGNPIVYEQTPEGIAKYYKDSAVQFANDIYKKESDKFFKANPDIHNVYRYKLAHGTIDGYNDEVDYRKYKLDESNEESLINTIATARVLRGEDKASIDDYVNYLKDNNKLSDIAKKEKTWLDSYSANRQKELDTLAETNRLKAEKEQNEYWDSVRNLIVNTKTLNLGDTKITIPEILKVKDGEGKILTKTPEDFFEYLTKPVQIKTDNGEVEEMTAHEYDLYQRNLNRKTDEDIYDALLLFLKQDKSQLIQQALRQERVNAIKEIRTSTKKHNIGKIESKENGLKGKSIKFEI